MPNFQQMEQYGVQRIHHIYDKDTSLKMIIVIHDRTLGPALGGIRFYDYLYEEDALEDAMRLARGMTFKNAIIHKLSSGRLSYGGGKSVIMGNPNKDKTKALLLAAAEAINELDGEYIGGEDMGTYDSDMEVMLERTKHVAGIQETHSKGGKRGGGDPSPITAIGVFEGIRSCLTYVYGTDWMKQRKFAIQGLGKVGFSLLEYLAVRSMPSNIIVTDKDTARIAKAKSEYPEINVLDPDHSDEIFDQQCDVFAPCAIGGIINDGTIKRLKCKIVAGAANNQLREPRHGEMLKELGILYAPDYVINAGGAINVSVELQPGGYDHDRADAFTRRIGPLLTQIFRAATAKNTTPEKVAGEMAEMVLKSRRDLNNVD